MKCRALRESSSVTLSSSCISSVIKRGITLGKNRPAIAASGSEARIFFVFSVLGCRQRFIASWCQKNHLNQKFKFLDKIRKYNLYYSLIYPIK